MERSFYTPPESITEGLFYKYTNIYSLSFMIYQILTGKELFRFPRGMNKCAFFINVIGGLRPDNSIIHNEDIVNFLKKCWNENTDERLTIDELIDFITSPNFCSYFNSLDHESIKRYFDIYGDIFNDLKDKF